MGINVRHDKPDGLVNHFKNTSVKDLKRKDGFGHCLGREQGAFHFGGDEKLLRVFGKQQQPRIGKLA